MTLSNRARIENATASVEFGIRRMGKGALATCPPSITNHDLKWWARYRFAYPTDCELICFCGHRDRDAQLRPNQHAGKSLRIIRNRVKPGNQKYSAFVLTQISRITPLVSRQMRGARERHERAVRCGGR